MADSALASLLDNDLYKFTMQHAVLQHYKDAQVTYQFTNREKNLHLNQEAVNWLTKQVQGMANLSLTEDEKAYLSQLSFFNSAYVDYLVDFRYRPSEHVKIKFDAATGDLDLEVSGLWHETILYEVPLLALISESYFRYVDQDWNYDGQLERAQLKAKRLLVAGCVFSEFGTRRRRDYKTHDTVMAALTSEYQAYQDQCKQRDVTPVGALSGTSNVHLARKYKVTPIGTVAHEFFMALSSLEGVEGANRKTLEKWYDTYHGALGIALTDTFTTPVFLKDFGQDLANKYIGVRQDSGSPSDFIPLMVEHYKSLGIDPQTKVIVFSDSLDVDRAIDLLALSKKHGIKANFGIGTSFTNDYQKLSHPSEKSKPLNIVIKIKECNGKRVIKLSDDVLKHSADVATVDEFKRQLGLS